MREGGDKRVTAVRELRKEDLARFAELRRGHVVKRLRDSHHHIAKMFASGMDAVQVAQRVGRTPASIRTIRKSPAFEQLLAEYRAIATEAWADSVDTYFDLASSNMVRAELQIADRLGEAEEAGETLPVRDLLAISRDAADRFGYGKRSTQVNVNADFAALLEKAIRRSGKSLDLVASKAPRTSEPPAPRAAPQALASEASPVPLAPLGDQRAKIPSAVTPLGVRDSDSFADQLAFATREPRAVGEVARSRQPHASPSFADELADALGQASVAQGVTDPPPRAGVTALPPPGAVTPFPRRRA